MRIIISPAKKMKVNTDSFSFQELPMFLSQAEQILKQLRRMSYAELKTLWKCNDQIAAQNIERIQTMDLRQRLTPALLAYDGIQYRYMAPGVFTNQEFAYVKEHLRILSGFYGILRPFDGVAPYRLEMGAKLSLGNSENLYCYWGSRLAEALFSESDYIINLASQEYSRCISSYIPAGKQFLTCVFGDRENGKVIEKGTLCKMARGEMVRWMAQEGVENLKRLKEFSGLGYQFSPAESTQTTYVFVKEVTMH